MAVTDKKFEAAANDIKKLTKRPDDEDMLRLYAMYKQGSEGDVQGERPGAFSFVDRAKYDAWAKLKGTSQDEAMTQYIALVDSLKG